MTRPRTPAPEPLTITELLDNPHNPRQEWKPEQVEPFRESLRRFGDLGGIVRNVTTGQLVGGHKRVEVFRQSPTTQIVKTDQPEDTQGTIAHGYVIVDGNRFAYREVRWSPELETAANLAANRWGAEWQWERVSEALQGIATDELRALTGFPAHELANLLAADWTPRAPGEIAETNGPAMHTIHLNPENYALLQHVKARLVGDGEPRSDAAVIVHLCEAFLGE